MDLTLFVNCITILILQLYSDPNLPRNVVDIVIEFFDKFHRQTYLPSLKADVLNALSNETLTNESVLNLDSVFLDHGLLFDEINTEAKRMSLLKTKGYREPSVIEIAKHLRTELIDDQVVLIFESVNALWSPLRQTFQLFLELPGVLNEILVYLSQLYQEHNVIRNIVQGNLWRQKYP